MSGQNPARCARCGHDATWELTQRQRGGHVVDATVCGRHVNDMLRSLLRGTASAHVQVRRWRSS
jgi:hypothetical protein